MGREDDLHKEQGDRLKRARKAAGYRSARAAALANGWAESSYRAHEAGKRTIGQDDAEIYARRFRTNSVTVTARDILFGEAGSLMRKVPVMGRIGAGAEIEPEYEQVSPEGLFEIEVPLGLTEDMVGFEVAGDSMYPRYEVGDVIICASDGEPQGITYMVEAAVRTVEGKRFLKRVIRDGDLFTLESHNAPPLRRVNLVWASPVLFTARPAGLRKIASKADGDRKRLQKPVSHIGQRKR